MCSAGTACYTQQSITPWGAFLLHYKERKFDRGEIIGRDSVSAEVTITALDS